MVLSMVEERFWILESTGSTVLSGIGSGFRSVYVAEIKGKLRVRDPVHAEAVAVITQKEWDNLPHVAVAADYSFPELLDRLRDYRAPVKEKSA